MPYLLRMAALLLVAGIIYSFSSQTYEEQSLVPLLKQMLPGEPFAGALSSCKVTYWGKEISIGTQGYYYFIEFFIRKFAHLFLFGVLAVAWFRVCAMYDPSRLVRSIWMAFAGTAGYAMIDELHQMYTGGRTPLLNDVLLDMFGAVLALALYVPAYTKRRPVWKRIDAGHQQIM
ncbi:VanZ family protein [Pseudobacillus badius]|uniref:VanZ family protein n=1 Tax=Bacillus badius TaxID=1455 RepID=UPI001CBF8EE0|nr:VanZ family protein [Bacillus badius]